MNRRKLIGLAFLFSPVLSLCQTDSLGNKSDFSQQDLKDWMIHKHRIKQKREKNNFLSYNSTVVKIILCLFIGCMMFSVPGLGQGPSKDSVPQRDLIDFFLKTFTKKNDTSERSVKKVNFSLMPLAGSSNGTGRVAVSAVNAAFYLGDPAVTNLSNIFFIPYTNFSNRYGFSISPSLWLNGNSWNLNGDLRFLRNEQLTYGLGANTTEQHPDTIRYRYIRVYLNANHKVRKSFYAGIGYALDYYYDVSESWADQLASPFTKYGLGTGKQTTSTGITLNALFDSRKNSINAVGGFYSALSVRLNPEFLANDYKWTSVYFDNRKYFSLSSRRHSVLAFWALYWGTFGDVPYLNLPGSALDLGGRSGRGYHQGRYRGKEMLYGESEYRFDISSNGLWGGVVFVNAQSYTEASSGRFEYVKPAAGFGLRLKFNKRSKTNITFDAAVGKDSFNWYINLGEFF